MRFRAPDQPPVPQPPHSRQLLLCSKARGDLPNLSDRLGLGFSTDSGYISNLEKTPKYELDARPRHRLYGRFNTQDPETGSDPSGKTFHTLEDQGIPPARIIADHRARRP